MRIRFALPCDIDAIVMLGAEAVLNGVWAPITHCDVDVTKRNVAAAVDAKLAFVAEHEGQVVGFILYRRMSFVFADSIQYLEVSCFYAVPEGRKLRDDRLHLPTASALLQASKDLANCTKLPVYVPVMWGPQIEARDRFMRKAGFNYVGGNFVFEPQEVEALQAAE